MSDGYQRLLRTIYERYENKTIFKDQTAYLIAIGCLIDSIEKLTEAIHKQHETKEPSTEAK